VALTNVTASSGQIDVKIHRLPGEILLGPASQKKDRRIYLMNKSHLSGDDKKNMKRRSGDDKKNMKRRSGDEAK